jgi:hypothetical protein
MSPYGAVLLERLSADGQRVLTDYELAASRVVQDSAVLLATVAATVLITRRRASATSRR